MKSVTTATILIPAGTIVLTQRDGLVTLSAPVQSEARRMRDGSWSFSYEDQRAECSGGLATRI